MAIGIGTPVMDDARIREQSQAQRASVIKRPWEEINGLPEQGNANYPLSPVYAIVGRKASAAHNTESVTLSNSQYSTESSHPAAKRTKLDREMSDTLSQNGRQRCSPAPPPPSKNPNYDRISNPTFQGGRLEYLTEHAAATGRPAEIPEDPYLCRECMKMASDKLVRSSPLSSCERCTNDTDLKWATQAAANALTQLADTLAVGRTSEERSAIRYPRLYSPTSPDCPPLSTSGLKQTLEWILGRIGQINYIADDLVRQVPADTVHWLKNQTLKDGTGPRSGLPDRMKRHIDIDTERSVEVNQVESMSDAKSRTRHRSSANTSLAAGDPTPANRPHTGYQLYEYPPRITFMNPPLVPSRQLPSPTRRSVVSPTSLSFPSPSTSSFGLTPQGVNLPLPLSLSQHSPLSSTYLPPISTSHSSDNALREHSASLQHEVSVQKIARSSLQEEHDKLLAALSRSQLRASALEKKHVVSDNEIVALGEEKMRLQQQITDLEQTVEDLTRSKDEYRQSAVKEGAQYIEIVKKATRLEEITLEENKTWIRLKGEMEKRIDKLMVKAPEGFSLNVAQPIVDEPLRRVAGGIDADTPMSSIDLPDKLKMESPVEG
ncbi:hypothetical protein BJ878DRAFT_538702 [Calycina marina]|uniref:Uncharacterized protein n=1 Tax=Calycina marina TaxID=1763456 RepID=A0A9P7Z9V0_9HELO|nr:hypothetical protein BJ878DRAFT_538702 [Calycina marina]